MMCENSSTSLIFKIKEPKSLWAAWLLHPRHFETRGDATSSDHVYVHRMKSTEFIDLTDVVLRCVCLRWSTDNEMDHSRGGTDESKTWNRKKEEEWFGIEPSAIVWALLPFEQVVTELPVGVGSIVSRLISCNKLKYFGIYYLSIMV